MAAECKTMIKEYDWYIKMLRTPRTPICALEKQGKQLGAHEKNL